jgi:hypothetical protein
LAFEQSERLVVKQMDGQVAIVHGGRVLTWWQVGKSSTVARTWAGFKAFVGYLLEHFLVQGQIRHQAAQPEILLLQSPKLAKNSYKTRGFAIK